MGAATSSAAAGFRVTSIQPNSLAHKLHFELFYDFIVSINDQVVSVEKPLSAQILEASRDGDLVIGLYNAARRTARRVIAARPNWGGPISLGATVRYRPFSCVHEEGLRVLRVFDNTPGASCGLNAGTDWIIASTDGNSISKLQDLARLLRQSAIEKVPMGLIVYNSLSGAAREVFCTPSVNSRGDPYLGVEFGHGTDDKIHFPTPTVSVQSSPTLSPVEAVSPEVGPPMSRNEEDLEKDSVKTPFSPSWLSIPADGTGITSSEEDKFGLFLKSLQDTTSLYDKLLARQLDSTQKFRLSGSLAPSIFDCDEIVDKGLRTQPVSIPYFVVSSD